MTDASVNRNTLFWRLQIGGWLAYSVLATAFSLQVFGAETVLSSVLPRNVLGFGFTCGLRYLFQRVRPQVRSVWVLAGGAFLLSGVLACVETVLMICFAPVPTEAGGKMDYHAFLASSAVIRWMLYWLWTQFYFGINYWLDTQDAKLRVAQAEAAAQRSELRFLQAQINPHFLFNALNTILSETERPATRALIRALSQYLRFSIRKPMEREPLQMELEAMEHYLDVEKGRFEDRFRYHIDVSPEALRALVPTALVQPLVENAIKYGRRTSPSLLTLGITAFREGEQLVVAVQNSGRWIPPEQSASTRTGIDNLRRRLSLLYGQEAGLCFSDDEEGVLARITMPYCTLT